MTHPKLVLEIELPEFNAEGMQEGADEWCDGDVLTIVLEEIMRGEVGLTIVTKPGEKSLNEDFEVHGMSARVVGARVVAA